MASANAQWMVDPENPNRETANIYGRCKSCDRIFPSLGVVPIGDRSVFGHDIDGGWYCAECRPRVFGRINGRGRAGVVYASVEEALAAIIRNAKPIGQ